jgi:DNA-directed RNA polymerase subunit RPC12/RpoP
MNVIKKMCQLIGTRKVRTSISEEDAEWLDTVAPHTPEAEQDEAATCPYCGAEPTYKGRVRTLSNINMTKMPPDLKDIESVTWIKSQYKGHSKKGMSTSYAQKILYQWQSLKEQGLAADPEPPEEEKQTA